MQDMQQRQLAARRRWVTAEEVPTLREIPGAALELLRPSEGDLSRLRARKLPTPELVALEIVKAHVVGWREFRESTLIPGGGSDTVNFDPRVWAEFIEDRGHWWAPLSGAIWAMVTEHEREIERLQGN